MSTRRPYSTDLSAEEWMILEPLVPDAKPGGRPRAHQTREILNAIFYVLLGGWAWRLLAHEFFLPWQRPPTTTSGRGPSTEPGSAYTTPPFARGCLAWQAERAYTERRHHRLANGQEYRARRSSGLLTVARR
jgi:transposase